MLLKCYFQFRQEMAINNFSEVFFIKFATILFQPSKKGKKKRERKKQCEQNLSI